jgi:transposase-like protein
MERVTLMKRKNHGPEQVVRMLRQADEQLATGQTVEQVCKALGVSEATYYKWRKQYGRMEEHQLRRLKALEKENARLKKVVAELSLDKSVLQEALAGK